ncbi:MAG: hypothetical protein JXA99_16020 [Candidatus Lokiarchaeota archaeon]|nr:hypothetical protein [Candidatus Lokiarchaeota archaeon]
MTGFEILKSKCYLEEKKKIIIRNVEINDINQILKLINDIYGKEYSDGEFYNSNYLKKLIKKSNVNEKSKIIWKCAYYGDHLIGQVILQKQFGIAIVKLAMVHNNFKNMGIMNLLGLKLAEYIDDLKNSNIFCVYAVVNQKNLKMIQVLENFKFKKYGSLPKHNLSENLLIYGRILKDFYWKMIKPDIKLSTNIYKIIKEAEIKRIISTEVFIPSFSENQKIILSIKINKHSLLKKKIYLMDEDDKIYAEISGNQHSWFNIRLISNNLTYCEKKQIFETIIKKFNLKGDIRSLSFIIDVNDKESQQILKENQLNLYAYLPFYYNHKDMVLLGSSKIE